MYIFSNELHYITQVVLFDLTYARPPAADFLPLSLSTMTNHFTSAPKVHFTHADSLNIFKLPLTTSEVVRDKEISRTKSDPISRSSVAVETIGRTFQKLTQLM